MDTKPKINPLIIGVVVLVLAGVGIWYWQSRKAAPTAPATEKNLGAQVFEKAQNPIKDKLPETNPFKVETNPFTGAQTNPLKGIIKNPF